MIIEVIWITGEDERPSMPRGRLKVIRNTSEMLRYMLLVIMPVMSLIIIVSPGCAIILLGKVGMGSMLESLRELSCIWGQGLHLCMGRIQC